MRTVASLHSPSRAEESHPNRYCRFAALILSDKATFYDLVDSVPLDNTGYRTLGTRMHRERVFRNDMRLFGGYENMNYSIFPITWIYVLGGRSFEYVR